MDENNYKVMENILQAINKKYISLPKDEISRNNEILRVATDSIIEKLKAESSLFANLYQTKYHGGSYYDGLKVGKPNEYDYDLLLVLPKTALPTVELSNQPGFVHVALKGLSVLEKKKDEAPKFVGIRDFLEDDKLSSDKVLAWFESLLDKTKKNFPCDDQKTGFTLKNVKGLHNVKATTSKSGPAITLKITGSCKDEPEKIFSFDVDLVICFKFTEKHWPQGSNYREVSPDFKNKTFFVVPKSPKNLPLHWRLSFQEQEKEILAGSQSVAGGYNVLKPALKLIKKLRDRHNDTLISSYFIKTIFLWETQENSELWRSSLSVVVMKMLNKYAEYLKDGTIPYFWNKDYNLLSNIKEGTLKQIGNKVTNITSKVDRQLKSDPFTIAQYFLLESEVEELRGEVDVSAKLLRKLQQEGSSPQKMLSPGASPPQNSDSSGFGETDLIDLEVSQSGSAVNSEEEEINVKLDRMTTEIGYLKGDLADMGKRFQEEFEKQSRRTERLLEFMSRIDAKLDRVLVKQGEKKSDIDILLDEVLGQFSKKPLNFP